MNSSHSFNGQLSSSPKNVSFLRGTFPRKCRLGMWGYARKRELSPRQHCSSEWTVLGYQVLPLSWPFCRGLLSPPLSSPIPVTRLGHMARASVRRTKRKKGHGMGVRFTCMALLETIASHSISTQIMIQTRCPEGERERGEWGCVGVSE